MMERDVLSQLLHRGLGLQIARRPTVRRAESAGESARIGIAAAQRDLRNREIAVTHQPKGFRHAELTVDGSWRCPEGPAEADFEIALPASGGAGQISNR